MHFEIVKPVGLASLCEEIENNCKNSPMFMRGGLRPYHIITPLSSGSGRTEIVRYMADMYKEHKVLGFHSSLDDFIEIEFDGTLQQLRQSFADIDDAADYSNHYENIIAMDISSIALHLSETQYTEFMDNCKKVCSHACVVFFTNSEPSRNEEKLIDALLCQIDNIKRIQVEPYTKEDLFLLIVRNLTNRDIHIENDILFRKHVMQLIEENMITTVKEANKMAGRIVALADYSSFKAAIDSRKIKTLLKNNGKRENRSDAV